MTTDKTPATLATVKHGGCVQLGQHDLRTSEGGRRFIADYFTRELHRHDFTRYITTRLAADFACALAQHLSAQPSLGGQGDAREIIEEFLQCATSGRPHGKLIAQAKDYLAARQPVCATVKDSLTVGGGQPVGEPVCSGGFVISNGSGEKYMAWGQVGPEWVADRSAALWLVRRADAEALAAENEDAWLILPVERCALPPSGWACTLAGGHEGPCPTIAAPPAQAVDLGSVRALLQRRIGQWRSHLPADTGAPGTREIETKAERDYNNDVRIYREGIAVMEEVLAKVDSQAVGK